MGKTDLEIQRDPELERIEDVYHEADRRMYEDKQNSKHNNGR